MKASKNMNTSQKIIQIILAEGGEITFSNLCNFLNIKEDALQKEFEDVKKIITVLGMNFIVQNKKASIAINSEVSQILENEENKDLQKPLSESALQTLSVILYKDKTTKAEIDFIRGVDSSRSLKTLLLRSLIEKHEDKNKRFYTTSTDTLRYLGISDLSSIPNKTEFEEKLNSLLKD